MQHILEKSYDFREIALIWICFAKNELKNKNKKILGNSISQSRPSCVGTTTPAHLATQQRFGVRIHGIESFVETSEVIEANLMQDAR